MNKYINDERINKEINSLIKSAKTSADNLACGADFVYNDLHVDDSKWEDLINMCEDFYSKLKEWEKNF